jgi:hypothetical protein
MPGMGCVFGEEEQIPRIGLQNLAGAVSLHGTAQNVKVLVLLNVKMWRRFVAGRRKYSMIHIWLLLSGAPIRTWASLPFTSSAVSLFALRIKGVADEAKAGSPLWMRYCQFRDT